MNHDIITSIRDKFIFLPPKLNKKMKKSENLFYIKNTHNKLISYFIYFPKSVNKYLIIWSHENKTNAYDYSDFLQNLCDLLGVTIVIYDYQGYGFSEGNSSEKNCYEDLETVINHFQKKYHLSNKSLYLIGHGLGTGIVIDYISKNNWETPVILITPYKSIFSFALSLDKYKSIFNVAKSYIDLDSINIFKSIDKINKVVCPIKIIHGEDNDFINISEAKDLYNKLSNKNLKPLWINNCGHFDILEKINFKQIFTEILHLPVFLTN